MLDRKQIDRCREILDSDHATNFESRMVAEVNLYWIIYEGARYTDTPPSYSDTPRLIIRTPLSKLGLACHVTRLPYT